MTNVNNESQYDITVSLLLHLLSSLFNIQSRIFSFSLFFFLMQLHTSNDSQMKSLHVNFDYVIALFH